MSKEKVVTINERIPTLKEQRKQRANRRLLFFLSFFFLLLLVMVYFQSPLSHVKNVTVEGNQFVSDEKVVELSGIKGGTSIWNLDKAAIIDRLLDDDEISAASVERKWFNTVNLVVREHARIGYLYANEHYYPILETGRYLAELPRQEYPADAPLLMNFEQGEALAEMAAELSKVPPQLIERISEIFLTPNESDPLALVLYMTDGNEVHSTIRGFSEKIAPYPSIVSDLDPEKKGILHMRMSPYFEEFVVEEEEDDSEGEG
ncbi:FtsQ-type POTRA domain-containing protein [Alkalihalobacillus oceani]|uniref:cell division protein FtsQ/DivIB n=1 Tax=Halalkalibacter oceani TaxID=1653776 RepID=UPI00203C401A|nr:FtsQ-type POTRA domain-containing protein [Halalkalibacter oceani]MCM3759353.1 FtsQ-type POTRA domain-containing protein [Halalkalibacter oceani]